MAESVSADKKRKVDDVEQGDEASSSSDSKTLVMEKGGSDEFFAQISGGEKNQKRLVVSKFKGTGECSRTSDIINGCIPPSPKFSPLSPLSPLSSLPSPLFGLISLSIDQSCCCGQRGA
jgi:hypothetical protein